MRTMRTMFIFAVCLSFLMLNDILWADKLAPSRTYVEPSKNGKYYIVMVPNVPYGEEGVGIAFKVEKDADKLLWQIDWYARQVYISDNGINLIRKGLWARDWRDLSDLAIAFYEKGKLLKSYQVSDLLEDKTSILRTATHYFWRPRDKEAPFGFSDTEDKFVLTTIEGKIFTFDVKSGELLSEKVWVKKNSRSFP